MSILFKFFQKIEEEGTHLYSFYKISNTVIAKSDNDTTRNENYWPISAMNIDAIIFNKILAKIQELINRIIHHDQVIINPWMLG